MWPALLFQAAVLMLAAELHLTADRNGTFVFHRRSARFVVLLFACPLAAFTIVMLVSEVLFALAPMSMAAWLMGLVVAIVLLLASLVLMVGFLVLILAPGVDRVFREVGPETPRGDRWAFGPAAQVPGTPIGVADAILERIAALPEGAIVVGVASRELRRELLARGGFTAGGGLRLYRVLGPTGPEEVGMPSENRVSGS